MAEKKEAAPKKSAEAEPKKSAEAAPKPTKETAPPSAPTTEFLGKTYVVTPEGGHRLVKD